MNQKGQMKFKSKWWSVRLPEDWQAAEDENCVTFSRKNSTSALQISAARKEAGSITDEELDDFATERLPVGTRPCRVNVGGLTGFYAERIENGVFWREWWLRQGRLIVYATYNVDENLKETESTIAQNILESLETIVH